MISDGDGSPYPESDLVHDITWSDTMRIENSNGDNWPMAWITDDRQIVAWGDGTGFDDERPLSLGFAEMRGDPPGLRVEEFESDADTEVGWGRDGRKASGLVMIDGTLYMFVRNARLGDDHRNARLAWSTDRGRTFEWADWNFSETFGAPAFVQFGPDYADARDEYVYVVSQANDDAYGFSPHLVLARVPVDDVPNRSAYEFYAGESDGEPAWNASIKDREAFFRDPKGTQRVAMTYNPGIDRYVLTASHEVPNQTGPHGPGFGLFTAPEPWGPWRTLYYDNDFLGGKGNGEGAYHFRFPPKWIRDDGRRMTMVYSRLVDDHYAFLIRDAALVLAG